MFSLYLFSRPNIYCLNQYNAHAHNCRCCNFPKTETPPCFLYLSTFQWVVTMM